MHQITCINTALLMFFFLTDIQFASQKGVSRLFIEQDILCVYLLSPNLSWNYCMCLYLPRSLRCFLSNCICTSIKQILEKERIWKFDSDSQTIKLSFALIKLTQIPKLSNLWTYVFAGIATVTLNKHPFTQFT